MFTSNANGVAVRLRLDSLVRFSPAVAPHVPMLRAAIGRHTFVVRARGGLGYVLDNRRWLHGRCSYTGERLMYRVTATARTGTIRGGFTTSGSDALVAVGGAR